MMTNGGFGELFLQAEAAYRRDRIAGEYGHRARADRWPVLRRRGRPGTSAAGGCGPAAG